jgi:hypothetical protein
MSFVWSTTGLPAPSIDYSTKLANTLARSKMESGRVRQRPRFTTSWRTVSVKWELTDAEWKLFQGVVFHKLSQGADFFDILLPLGNGMQTYTARFVADSIQESHRPVLHWVVSAQLELQGVSPLTDGEVDALLIP